MRRLLIPALLLTALLLGGCGSDDGSSGGTDADQEETGDTASAADQDTEVAPDVDPAADQEAADGAVAAFDAFMAEEGFVAVPEDDDDSDLEFESEECQELDELFSSEEELEGETASADSDEFERGEFDPAGGVQEGLEASVGFVDDEAILEQVLVDFGDDRIPGCLEEGMRLSFEESAEDDPDAPPMDIVDITAESSEVDGVGDEALAIDLTMTIEVTGIELATSMRIEVVREGRSAVLVMSSVLGEGGDPVPTANEAVQVILDSLGTSTN